MKGIWPSFLKNKEEVTGDGRERDSFYVGGDEGF